MYFSVLDIRHESTYICQVSISLDSFILHLQFSLNLRGAKKSCKDSQVSTRMFDTFPPNLFHDIEIHSGQLMITHISDVLTCYNMLNFLVSQLPEPQITYNVKSLKS